MKTVETKPAIGTVVPLPESNLVENIALLHDEAAALQMQVEHLAKRVAIKRAEMWGLIQSLLPALDWARVAWNYNRKRHDLTAVRTAEVYESVEDLDALRKDMKDE